MKKREKQIKKIDKSASLGNLWLYFILIVLAILIVTVIVASALAKLINDLLGITIELSIYAWTVLFSVLIGGTMSILIGQMFFLPVIKLSNAMKKVASGDFGVRMNSNGRIHEINVMADNFNLMVKELGATEILQSDFVSNVSHEFKTPLAVIEGYALLLQDKTLTEDERSAYTEKILLNTKRLSNLVGNILLLSKVDNQAIMSKKTNYRLDEQIRQTLVLLEPKWTEKNLDLQADLEEINYEGNEQLLQHVWTNLIDNAIKFDPYGGLLKLTLKKENDKILFSVEDSGEGISEEASHHIYDKFYQADSSHKGEGNGLGLSLVKRILDISGGSVEFANREEEGSIFTVKLGK